MFKQLSRKQVYAAVLTAAPLLFLLYCVFRYTVNIPDKDDWALLEALAKYHEGRLTFADLWVNHNEHRMLFPKTLMLIAAVCSGWNQYYFYAMNFAAGLLTFVFLIWQTKKVFRALNRDWPLWLLPALSVVFFSLAQWQPWCWGYSFKIFFGRLAAWTGLWLLAYPGAKGKGFFAALLLGTVTTYSYVSGVSYWPAGLLTLVLMAVWRKENLLGRICIWTAYAALAGTVYFIAFRHTELQPYSWQDILRHPLDFFNFLLIHLGSPLAAPLPWPSAVLGLLILSLFFLLLCRLAKHEVLRSYALPYISIAFYGLGAGLLITYGRMGEANLLVLLPYYIMGAVSFVIPVIILAGIDGLGQGPLKKSGAVLAGILAGLIIYGNINGAGNLRARKEALEVTAEELHREKNFFMLRHLTYSPEEVPKWMVKSMRKYQLGIFHPGLKSYQPRTYRRDKENIIANEDGALYRPAPAGKMSGYLNQAYEGFPYLKFGGWAVDAEKKESAAQIAVFLNGEYFYSCPLFTLRPDVAVLFHSQACRKSGFAMAFPMYLFPRGEKFSLRFFALSRDGFYAELQYPEHYPLIDVK